MLGPAAAQHHERGLLAEMLLAKRSYRHYGCSLHGFALQHVCSPAEGGAHELQGSAQLCRPCVGVTHGCPVGRLFHQALRRDLAPLLNAMLRLLTNNTQSPIKGICPESRILNLF
jgi:hypothetical protein